MLFIHPFLNSHSTSIRTSLHRLKKKSPKIEIKTRHLYCWVSSAYFHVSEGVCSYISKRYQAGTDYSVSLTRIFRIEVPIFMTSLIHVDKHSLTCFTFICCSLFANQHQIIHFLLIFKMN